VQFVGLVAYSSYLFGRGDLTADFAHNVQAWFLIGHGHLDPTDTVRIVAIPFWRDHFDLALWPLGLLQWIWPNPVILLWLQDAAIVAAELVTLRWVVSICDLRLARYRNTVALATMVVLVANPWWYETASFDVHMTPLALPFVMGAAYSLSCGRSRRALVLAALALLFGAVAAELVFFVGAAGLLSRDVRNNGGARSALGILAVGGLWVVVVTALGANQASNIGSEYGYLVGVGSNASAFSILSGLVVHPAPAVHALATRWGEIERVLSATGFLGVFSPWGLAGLMSTMLPAALAQSPSYAQAIDAFQTLPAMPLLTVGALSVLVSIATRSSLPLARIRPAGTWIAASLLIGIAGIGDWGVARQIPSEWWLVDAPAASTLRSALPEIPAKAEVIASEGVMGLFAEHTFVYQLVWSPQRFKVSSSVVVFVIAPSQGQEPKNRTSAESDLPYVVQHLGGRELVVDNGVAVVEWFPPRGTTAVTLP